MKFLYGQKNIYKDITTIVFEKCYINGIINIPDTDSKRGKLFGDDPLKNVLKHIKFINNKNQTTFYDHYTKIKILLTYQEIRDIKDIKTCHDYLCSQLKIIGGNFQQELPEQLMSIKFIEPNDIVLEIGGNIGRNSLVIASLLNNSANLLVMESNPKYCKTLIKNKTINNLNFHIENSALSEYKMLQRGWNTIIYKGEDVTDYGKNFFWINIINYSELINKYNLDFNTLVLDCEGAFYYILKSFPQIIKNINKIIIENDFKDKNHKRYVHNTLIKNDFLIIYKETNGNKVGFYKVWKKK
jgi:FkbM family methyltransferase